jgi:hypothetical protein
VLVVEGQQFEEIVGIWEITIMPGGLFKAK